MDLKHLNQRHCTKVYIYHKTNDEALMQVYDQQTLTLDQCRYSATLMHNEYVRRYNKYPTVIRVVYYKNWEESSAKRLKFVYVEDPDPDFNLVMSERRRCAIFVVDRKV